MAIVLRSASGTRSGEKIKKLTFTPGLAVVQVGDDPASTLYIKHKQRDCEKVHFHSEVHHLPADINQDTLIEHVEALNERTDIHGILVQMPLPEDIDKEAVIDKITPHKDADGLNPVNLGNLLINREGVTPCTPTGIIRLIELTGEQIEGKHAVCIGRSPLVGKSVGLMLLNRKCYRYLLSFPNGRLDGRGSESRHSRRRCR